MKEIDAKGLACPEPVLQTKAAMEEGNADVLKIIVDNEASMENVLRFLEFNSYKVSTDRQEDFFVITGKLDTASASKNIDPAVQKNIEETIENKKIMVLCGTDRMGFGDDELGLKLMISFLKTLEEMGPELWRLVFVNNGVKLTTQDSEVLPVLKKYAKKGIMIMVCGTCLTHFNLLEKKRVGETTNMLDIVTAMQLADKVINI